MEVVSLKSAKDLSREVCAGETELAIQRMEVDC